MTVELSREELIAAFRRRYETALARFPKSKYPDLARLNVEATYREMREVETLGERRPLAERIFERQDEARTVAAAASERTAG